MSVQAWLIDFDGTLYRAPWVRLAMAAELGLTGWHVVRTLRHFREEQERIRAELRRRRIKTTIPERIDQQAHRARKGSQGGRPPQFDPATYKDRNVIERCINKLKQFRAVATRYDKREYIFHGTVDVASIRIWLRDPVP